MILYDVVELGEYILIVLPSCLYQIIIGRVIMYPSIYCVLNVYVYINSLFMPLYIYSRAWILLQ